MNKHIIESMSNINANDFNRLLLDSRRSEFMLSHVANLLKTDTISSITWLRIIDERTFQFITNLSSNELKDYLYAGVWRQDKLMTPLQTTAFEVFDYESISAQGISERYIKQHIQNLTLFIGKSYHLYTDNFAFDIDKAYFNGLSLEQKMLVYERLTESIHLLMSSVFFQNEFQFKTVEFSYKAIDKPKLPEEVKKDFDLSDLNVEYLRFIATGATAKEIAIHLDKSFRSVQGNIAQLCEKLGCINKNQLSVFARIISSYVQ